MNLNRKLQRLPFLPRTNPHLAPPSAGSGGAHEASLRPLLEFVVVAVQHGGHGIHLFGEHSKIQLGVALLHHAA